MSKIKRLKSKQVRERKALKKQQELEDLREEGPEEESKLAEEKPTEPDAPERLEKYYDAYGYPMPSPTSFEELDEAREAQEKATQVEQVTWDTRQLVNNILWDPSTEASEKGKKIAKVAGEFESRVSDALKPSNVRKDMDVLQIEAILAADARATGLIEKGVNLVKSLLSGGGEINLSDENLDLSGKDHVRKALAQAVRQIEGGGDSAEVARSALPRIRTAAKETGVEAGIDRSAIIIQKDDKGDWRWIGKPTNNFIDWQEDILAKSAHQKYVAFLDENPECAPVFLSWHTPGTAREHPVDFWMEHEGAVIMSGILTEDEAAALLTVQKSVDLGMSHQAFALRLDPEDSRVVTDYWIYEVSDLPLDKAANPFTTLETMVKEVGMDKLDYLTKIMGSEKAKAYLEKTSQTQKELQAAGITSKAKEEEKPAEKPTAAAAPTVPATPSSLDMSAIVKELEKHLDIDGLNAFVAQAQEDHAKVEVLEGLVKELSQSDDERLEKVLTPPVSRFAWSQGKRASQSEATKLQKENSEDKTLDDSTPGVPEDYWLSKATGTAPVTAS